MKGTAGIVKGRIKESAGVLVGNDKLRARGQRDQVVGHIRKEAEKSVDSARAEARDLVKKAKAVARRAVNGA